MNPFHHKTKTKFIAAILIFYLIAFFTLALAYEVQEAHHTCQGENCPVCHHIQDLEHTREQFSFSAGNVSVFICAFLSILRVAHQKTTEIRGKTPVQLHVRLNR